jgi:hypothetical protein
MQLFPAGEHATHAPPPEPHWLLDVPGSQVRPLQQPFAQLAASQTHAPLTHSCPAGQLVAVQAQAPLTHTSPVAHEMQAAPSVPHWAAVGGVTHDVPTQQPVAQSVALQ